MADEHDVMLVSVEDRTVHGLDLDENEPVSVVVPRERAEALREILLAEADREYDPSHGVEPSAVVLTSSEFFQEEVG